MVAGGQSDKRDQPADGVARVMLSVQGDQRSAENIVLELRSMARRHGLDLPAIEITSRPSPALPDRQAVGDQDE